MKENKPCKCGNKFVVNRTYNLCNDCNYYRLHGKTPFEAAQDKERVKPVKIYHIKRTPLKRSKKAIKSTKETKEKRRETLRKDRELYKYIFDTKLPECEECQEPLPDVFEDDEGNIVYIAQYSHILSKGSSPEFRHNKLNINRLCLGCHDKWEFSDKENMKIYKSNQLIIEKMKINFLK